VSERTANPVFSDLSSWYYWFTTRQIGRQSTCLFCCLHGSCTLWDKPLINPGNSHRISSHSHCNSFYFTLRLRFLSSVDDAGMREHSPKHMSANMAVDLKSNLFSRRERRKIDVHISSINGFHNSLAWWTGTGSCKLWQVHSQFSWLIGSQISPLSMSCGTLWSNAGIWGSHAAAPTVQAKFNTKVDFSHLSSLDYNIVMF